MDDKKLLALAVKCLAAEAALYATAYAALFALYRSVGWEEACGGVLAVAAALWLFDAAGCLACRVVARRGGKGLMGFYLLSKAVKLFAAIAAVALFGVLYRSALTPFAIGVFAYYVIGLSATSVFYVKVEQHLKNKR